MFTAIPSLHGWLSARMLGAVLVCWLAAGAGALSAQITQSRVRFEHIGIAEGLPNESILSLHQDQQGFIWIGTEDGLVRYDGYDFVVFKHDPEDSGSISDTSIECILESRDGTLWFGTYLGMSRFDLNTQTFTNYHHDLQNPSTGYGSVRSLYEDQGGVIWVGAGSNNLYRFDPQTEAFTHYVLPLPEASSPGMPFDDIYGIVEDDVGMMWVETDIGLYGFDTQQAVFTYYPLESVELEVRGVGALYKDEDGMLWAGNWGLHRFNPATGEATQFLLDPTNSVPNAADPTNAVRAIVRDPSGKLWVGTSGGGLYLFDPTTGHSEHFTHDSGVPFSLQTNLILALILDRSGVLWVGGRANGVFRYRLGTDRVTHLNSEGWLSGREGGFYEDVWRRRWLGLRQGVVVHLDTTLAVVEQYTLPDQLGTAGVIQAFYVRPSEPEELWIGTVNTGVYRLHLPSGRFTWYQHDPEDPRSLGDNDVQEFHESPYQPGMLWIGTGNGLNRLDLATDTFTRYLPDAEHPGSIGGSSVPDINEDRQGNLWIALDGFGLDRFDKTTEQFTHFQHDPNDPTTLSNNGARFIHASRREPGVLWIGTWSGGINRFDTQTETFTRFTRQNSGLPDNHVEVILEDEDGYLWLGTFSGISRMDPRTNTFKPFGTGSGIQGRSIFEGVQSRTGELLFKGGAGLDVFYPDQLVESQDPPMVVLSDFKLSGESVRPRPDSFLPVHISFTKRIDLRHDQHDISFDFVALHFSDPAGNQYQYRLEGYDTDWFTSRTQRTATYTNLDPGTYTFHVKAANSDGYWNEEGTSVTIMIHPPWWRTTGAYLLYGLLVLGSIFAADRFQRRRLIARERAKAQARELEQAREIEKAYTQLKATQAQLVQQEKMASLGQLTAGIAHEIKNPLNFVNNFAEVNEELAQELREALAEGEDVTDLIDDLEQNARVINQHGKRADGIVHAMMQHASGGTGQREATDINALVSEHIDLAYHSKRAQLPGLQVEIERDLGKDTSDVEVVPQEIGRVLLNLLGNAFDAVHEHATRVNGQYAPIVVVSTRQADGRVAIRVTDNGPGIPTEIKDKIFEPFFTTKPTGAGTGLGLSLSYDIVTQGHGGTMTVESEEGEGATFIVSLPLNDKPPDSST